MPWEISKAFDNSAAIGKFISKSGEEIQNVNFISILMANSAESNTEEMIYSVDKIIHILAVLYSKIGILYIQALLLVRPVAIDDHLRDI